MLLNKLVMFIFFFFKQKTAYEMRSSDWSSDVCSSDLVVLRSGPGAFHRVPAVGRAGRVVDDDRGLRALARGFLELVGPAPVIGHALAFEQALVAGVAAGGVDQDDDGLALHVDAGVVVPVPMGRAACREGGVRYGESSVCDGSLKHKKTK